MIVRGIHDVIDAVESGKSAFTRWVADGCADAWEFGSLLDYCMVTKDGSQRLRPVAVEASTDVQDGITWCKDW